MEQRGLIADLALRLLERAVGVGPVVTGAGERFGFLQIGRDERRIVRRILDAAAVEHHHDAAVMAEGFRRALDVPGHGRVGMNDGFDAPFDAASQGNDDAEAKQLLP